MKKKLGMFCFIFAMGFAFATPVLAAAATYLYDVYYITYDCSVSSTKGTAYTTGNTKPYYNFASIVVYKDGDAKGSDFTWVGNSGKASVKVSGKLGLNSARSLHAVADANHNTLLSSKYTRVRYATR